MLRHYLTLSIKVLLRRKVFTLISLFGIVSTLVVFVVLAAFIDHGFGPGAPEGHRDRMLSVMRVSMFGPHTTMNTSGGYALFDRYARNLPGAQYLSIFSNRIGVDAFVDGAKVTLDMKRTDGDFWNVFTFDFIEGRPYGARDVETATFVAVISAAARDRLLGEGPAVGRTIEVDGQRFRVAGVVESVSEMRNLPFADVWVPLTTAKTPPGGELMGGFQAAVVGETSDALPGIRAEFDARLRRVELPSGIETIMAPFETQFEGFARQLVNDRDPGSKVPRLLGIMTGLGLLLALLPTVNLVNLNISRIMERASEIGVRKAFGASSVTLVGQFIVENVLLTLVGAAVAFVLSGLVLHAINVSGAIAHAHLVISLRVFLAGSALAVAFGLLSGVYPAWRMSRLHPVRALKG